MRLLLLVLAVTWVPALAAQRPNDDDVRRVPVAPLLELRAVLPVDENPEVQVGPGLSLRAGWYVRLAAAALGGAVWTDSSSVGVARVEAAMRFHLDPFFEAPGCRARDERGGCRGLYGGVGLSQRFLGSGIGAEDPVLVLILGLEGRRRPSGVWAAELGLGGGLRIGATWRPRRDDGYR
jgi:hypothetical protein